jgi:hypothetical protein
MVISAIDKVDLSLRLLESAVEAEPECDLQWMAQALAHAMAKDDYVLSGADVLAAVVVIDMMEHFGCDKKAKDLLKEAEVWKQRN